MHSGCAGPLAPLLLHHWHIDILLTLGIDQDSDAWQQASDYLTWIGGGTLLLASNLAVPICCATTADLASPWCW